MTQEIWAHELQTTNGDIFCDDFEKLFIRELTYFTDFSHLGATEAAGYEGRITEEEIENGRDSQVPRD